MVRGQRRRRRRWPANGLRRGLGSPSRAWAGDLWPQGVRIPGGSWARGWGSTFSRIHALHSRGGELKTTTLPICCVGGRWAHGKARLRRHSQAPQTEVAVSIKAPTRDRRPCEWAWRVFIQAWGTRGALGEPDPARLPGWVAPGTSVPWVGVDGQARRLRPLLAHCSLPSGPRSPLRTEHACSEARQLPFGRTLSGQLANEMLGRCL